MTADALVRAAAAAAARQLAVGRDRPVVPGPQALAGLAAFDPGHLDRPLGAEEALRLLEDAGGPATVVQGDGRYFGFVNGGVLPVARAADVLASAWDQNAALPVMSPLAVHLEEVVGGWVLDLLGLPPRAAVSLCGGATLANLTAVLTARDELLRRVGWDVAAEGLGGAPAIRVVTSAEHHTSVAKVVRLAGLGTARLETVRTDEVGALDASALPADLDDGRPTLVLLQVGNVVTGAHDPVDAVVARTDPATTWVHVDGAFGLWAAASPRLAGTLSGVAGADSWATDGHKTLNTPYDCGITIVRDEAALRRAMSMDASYASAGGEHAPMNLGLQMSQRARSLPLWAALATLGRAGVAALVEQLHELALRAATALAAGGAEVVAPVVFNQCAVAFGDDATTDAVVAEVQRGGTVWLGGATWRGRRVARVSVSDAATDTADVDTLVAGLLGAWDRVDPGHDRADRGRR